jgi:hypothetical protein
MDTTKLSEVFANLKSLLSNANSGRQWSQPGQLKEPKPAVTVSDGWVGGADEETIVAVADETRLYALGLQNQPRLTRKHIFVCSAQPVTEPHRFGQLVCDGRQFYLVQLLRTNGMEWLVGQRCLLTSGGEHTGRKVKVAWKLQDGVGYQLIHEDRRKYIVIRHTATFVELDQAPERHGTGYLVIQFL